MLGAEHAMAYRTHFGTPLPDGYYNGGEWADRATGGWDWSGITGQAAEHGQSPSTTFQSDDDFLKNGPLHAVPFEDAREMLQVVGADEAPPWFMKLRLRNALRIGHTQEALELLAHGVDPRGPSDTEAPLSLALRGGSAALVEALLSRGESQIEPGRPGLPDPVNVPFVLWRLPEGAETGAVLDLLHKTGLPMLGPLHDEHFRPGCPTILRWLVARGVDLNRLDADGLAPFHRLLLHCEGNAERHLRARSENPWAPTPDGRDATGVVVAEYVALALALGADLEVRTREGKSPLRLALEWDRARVADALLSRGADPESRDDAGHSLYELARAKVESHGYGSLAARKIVDAVKRRNQGEPAGSR